MKTKDNNLGEFLELIQKNPDIPVVPMVDGEIVGCDSFYLWLGRWGRSEITKYYEGRENIHFEYDDPEDVLCDMKDCKPCMTTDGRDIYDLTDDEWNEIYSGLPWVKAIVVYITT